MAWTANCTVSTVNGNNIVMSAFGTDITNTDDDNVQSATIELTVADNTHIAVGSKIQVSADC